MSAVLARRCAEALARYLLDEYPKARKTTTREADYWIAVDYRIRVDHLGEMAKNAAADISSALRNQRRNVTASRIKKIGSEFAREEIHDQVLHTLKTFDHLRDPLAAARQAQDSAQFYWRLALRESEERKLRPKKKARKPT
jgi:hypothetical protein